MPAVALLGTVPPPWTSISHFGSTPALPELAGETGDVGRDASCAVVGTATRSTSNGAAPSEKIGIRGVVRRFVVLAKFTALTTISNSRERLHLPNQSLGSRVTVCTRP